MTTFWIVCTDRETHTSRELAKLEWRGADADPEIWEPLLLDATSGAAEFDLDDVEAVRGWDALDVSAGRSARRGGVVKASVVVEREVADDHGPLWRFRCPTCGRDVPIQDKNLRAVVVSFVATGASRLDISAMR